MPPAKSKKIHKLVENSLSINNSALFNSLGPPFRSTTCHRCGLFGKHISLTCLFHTFENIFTMESSKILSMNRIVYLCCIPISLLQQLPASYSSCSSIHTFPLLLLPYSIIISCSFVCDKIYMHWHAQTHTPIKIQNISIFLESSLLAPSSLSGCWRQPQWVFF